MKTLLLCTTDHQMVDHWACSETLYAYSTCQTSSITLHPWSLTTTQPTHTHTHTHRLKYSHICVNMCVYSSNTSLNVTVRCSLWGCTVRKWQSLIHTHISPVSVLEGCSLTVLDVVWPWGVTIFHHKKSWWNTPPSKKRLFIWVIAVLLLYEWQFQFEQMDLT